MTTAVAGSGPNPLRRAAAAVALAALVAALLYLAVSAVQRWDVLLVTVVSLVVAVMAAWYILSRRGVARAVAVGVAALALVVFAVAVVASESLIVLAVGLGLAAVSVGAAGYALSSAAHRQRSRARAGCASPGPADEPQVRWGQGRAVPGWSTCVGSAISSPSCLRPGDDLRQLAEDAVARGADLLGMAGGDGSQALVASVASQHHIPFVVVPAGTRNHFALDLGIDRDDVPGALDAYQDGVDATVDLAEVNGRVFVNNSSMGVYAEIVQSTDYRDAKMQTVAAMLPELLGPESMPLDLRFTLPSGEEVTTAQLLLVSNNAYDLAHLRGGGTRERSTAAYSGSPLYESTPRGGQKARRAGSRRPRSALSELERVDSVGVRGALRRASGDRRRRRGLENPATAALHHPTWCAHGQAATHSTGAIARRAHRTRHGQADG